jgi:hypothetical protein
MINLKNTQIRKKVDLSDKKNKILINKYKVKDNRKQNYWELSRLHKHLCLVEVQLEKGDNKIKIDMEVELICTH